MARRLTGPVTEAPDEEKHRELLAVEQKDEEKRVALEWKRRAIFSENMVACVPWNLPPGELQAWLIERASRTQRRLCALIGRMGDISGLTVLQNWVEVGGTH